MPCEDVVPNDGLSERRGSEEDAGHGTSAWSGDTVGERPSLPGLSLRIRFTSTWARKQSVVENACADRQGSGSARGPLGLRLLHASPEPLIDFVFVHGLRGGSVKTWRKDNDPRNFWPQVWLPLEPGLRNANVHSFGYESDWASTKSSVLDVHDFGQSLLEEMRNSPDLRDNGNRPIFLIGHSMGGLVIKKAYILAGDVPGFQRRIRAIFFLATPHRGSDYAALLNNILTVSGVLSSRQYVADLTRGSRSAERINEDFGKCAGDLRNIPEGMVPYYERTIRSMAEKKERHISGAVLMWVVASLRKLTIQELACALELDVKAVFPNAQSAVEGLCGQLVSVDNHSGVQVVELVHSTAREFLLSEPAAPFTVVKSQAHERIALTCLDLLCSTEMQPPRSRRHLSRIQKPKTSQPPALLDYAIHQFSAHVCLASSETDHEQLLVHLDRLFRTNILSWIEVIARQGSLHPLIRVSKNLKSYLDRRAKYLSPLRTREVQTLDAWSTDLSRLATKFGSALLENPASIHFLIPPLCPSRSAIHQRFAKRSDGLAVVGHTESTWDDCTASVGFGEDGVASAASSGQDLISVGMRSGDIELFDSHSFQKVAVVQAKAPVDLVHLTEKGIAACTTRAVLLSTREGQVLWETRLRFRCILLTSTYRAVVAVSQHGHVLQWDISNGALLEDQTFACRKPDGGGEGIPVLRAPHVASVSADTDMLALGYSTGTICIFDMSSGELVCWAGAGVEQNKLASVLLFHPNPNVNRLLLVVFSSHELALYDIFSGELVRVGMKATPSTAGVLSGCCSPEGRTLATMDTHGVLKVWDFETLNLLYHVSTPTRYFSILNFTTDALEIVDVFDSGMRIWGPAALVRDTNEEDRSIGEEAAHLPPIEGEYEMRRISKITALCAHPTLSLVFVGKQDGQVIAFDTKTGTRVAVLYTHAHRAGVTELIANKNNLLASSDHNGILQVWGLGIGGQPPTLHVKVDVDNRSMRFTAYSTSHVRQICFSASGDLLLLATELFDRIYSTADGSCLGIIDFKPEERGIWRWLADPTTGQGETFYLLSSYTLTKYDRAARRMGDPMAQLEIPAVDNGEAAGIDSATICPSTRTLAVSVRYLSGYVSSSNTFLFDLSKENPAPRPDAAAPSTPTLNPSRALSNDTPRYWKKFLGVDDRAGKFVFLHQNSWVCSADIASLAEGQFTQHFFVPNEYASTASEVLPVRTADNGVVFGLNGEITIVKNGFNFGRTRTFA